MKLEQLAGDPDDEQGAAHRYLISSSVKGMF